MAKYGMSMCVLGMAEELRKAGIAVNALWPRTIIATAALQMIPGIDPREGRKPEIMADAAHWILTQPGRECSGNFFIDEEVLRRAGGSDFRKYAVDPGRTPRTDLFLD
jgi:citronellol/citronellal dehydrogenase